MTKIFARERRKIEKGEKKPRYRIVATSGDIKFFAEHIRKLELENIAKELNAEIVYLPTSALGIGGEKG